jgi:lipopolysaccharide export system permease protein
LIIRRYLVKQVVSTSLVVIALLTLIMMGGRLIKYFGVAAQGRHSGSNRPVSTVF